MNAQLLQEGARSFGLELDAKRFELFRCYLAELLRWNRSINLTAITQPDKVVSKHFVDSLSIVPLLEPKARLLDIGSGAGFPALPVATVRPDLVVHSLDAVDKKVRFQRHICRLLALEQVTVLHGRVEQLAHEQPRAYDVVTSRAFRDVERFIQLAHQLVRPGGRLVAMAAGGDERSEAGIETLARQFGLRYQQTIAYELPGHMGARKLLVFERNSL